MDAYEALKETFDDLFQQAVEEGCYTEDEATELVESLDIYSLLQVVRHNATTVYSYITQGRQERSFNYRGEDLFRQRLPCCMRKPIRLRWRLWWLPAPWSCGSWKICPWRLSPA